MMPPVSKTLISEDEYLELERQASYKSEYYKAEIFAKAAATKEHNAIVGSLMGELCGFLKGKHCKVFSSDLRVHNSYNGFYTYPDVTIVCGKEEYFDDQFDTLLNPAVLFEVLSTTSEDYDRGTKFKLYRTISSLQNYVLVSSTEVSAEVYTKSDENRVLSTVKDKTGYIHISSIKYNLALSDIYSQVDAFADSSI